MRTRFALCLLTLTLAACGSSPTGPELKTERFTFTITDPTACNCGDGIAQYTIVVAAGGSLDAVTTWTPADATVIVRLLSEDFNTVLATGTVTGTSSRLTQAVTPGTYRVQLFLAGSGGRTASFQLAVTHP